MQCDCWQTPSQQCRRTKMAASFEPKWPQFISPLEVGWTRLSAFICTFGSPESGILRWDGVTVPLSQANLLLTEKLALRVHHRPGVHQALHIPLLAPPHRPSLRRADCRACQRRCDWGLLFGCRSWFWGSAVPCNMAQLLAVLTAHMPAAPSPLLRPSGLLLL